MKIGITAATAFEIEPAMAFLLQSGKLPANHEFEILITGIGSVATAYQVAKFIFKHSPDYIIQAGIGGLFNTNIPLCEPAIIKDEVIGDIGVQENNLFKDLFDMGFMNHDDTPYTGGYLINPDTSFLEQFALPLLRGITVNEISTDPDRISLLGDKYACDIESMEGAAFHYVCLQENIPFLQLRSASNYIGERDKNKWQLKQAISKLNNTLIKIIQQIR